MAVGSITPLLLVISRGWKTPTTAVRETGPKYRLSKLLSTRVEKTKSSSGPSLRHSQPVREHPPLPVRGGDRRAVQAVDHQAVRGHANPVAGTGGHALQHQGVMQITKPTVGVGKGRRRRLEGDHLADADRAPDWRHTGQAARSAWR